VKRDGTIGVAALLAIVAVAGFSLQSGPKPEGSARAERGPVQASKPSTGGNEPQKALPGCQQIADELKEFLDVPVTPPETCLSSAHAPDDKHAAEVVARSARLKLIIATLPDPVHTHLSANFDQTAAAIQEAAQDEKYDFDRSWLPWDDEVPSYALLSDEKTFNQERQQKESQPGIILFRRTVDCSGKQPPESCGENAAGLSPSYQEGLVIFVVGEEATEGLHRDQFRSALAWIGKLQPSGPPQRRRMAVLGPSFSGSLPSLAQLLSEPETAAVLDLRKRRERLAIYSGSVSGRDSALAFAKALDSRVTFHSFVQNDDKILARFCGYMTREQPRFNPRRLAVVSEDETAYGSSGIEAKDETADGSSGIDTQDGRCSTQSLKLYYPRDISALRGAYQTKSLFDVGATPQAADTQRRSLPTDLADPAGKVHDSIRSYGGNQTPLTQEAFLLGIAAALRDFHARYILLRSSNTLDQLFLTNFLRRTSPDVRIVILGSDLMFARERGTTGLAGVMTLSNYPLFPLERDWTEHPSFPAADRVFSGDTIEGTYVALRLLLNEKGLNGGQVNPDGCYVLEASHEASDRARDLFVPPIACRGDAPKNSPIPDYAPPHWVPGLQEKQSDAACIYPGPATWVSVIAANRFWPMASLTDEPRPVAVPPDFQCAETPTNQKRSEEPGANPEMPPGMKVFLLVLVGFSLFHLWCCSNGSYTAKPAFRSHFASSGDPRQKLLVFGLSCCLAFLAIVAGWGCGAFYWLAWDLDHRWFALAAVATVSIVCGAAIRAHNVANWKLVCTCEQHRQRRLYDRRFRAWKTSGLAFFAAALIVFCLGFILPVDYTLDDKNSVLTFWRAMHLGSGVSPILPMFMMFAGLYLTFWLGLHGLALFGPDRPRLPPKRSLLIKDLAGKDRDFLKMFSHEHAGRQIEYLGVPLRRKVVEVGALIFVLFLAVAFGVAQGVPVRSLGARSYAVIFIVWLDLCCSLSIVEAWRLYETWEKLKLLLTFLDRLPLRRTFAVLHGFSWGSVWKMSGNVLDVRYKVISRQMESMNHSIASLDELADNSSGPGESGAATALASLRAMRKEGFRFAEWYAANYADPEAGDLSRFKCFQAAIAEAAGTLLSQLLVPAWRKEQHSLIQAPPKPKEEKDKEEGGSGTPSPAREERIRNTEEFVCLAYLGFIQNILGRLRTMALTIVVLFVAAALAMSTYPFDPRQPLSAVLVGLFVAVGTVMVKVYAEMHRDATLSHVTNTKPGELGAEFWVKLVGFGFAPLVGLLTRVFPGITDFALSWLQPGLSSLK